MPKARAVTVINVRLELSQSQIEAMRRAASGRPMTAWVTYALRNGLAYKGELPSEWIARHAPRVSLFLELDPGLVEMITKQAKRKGKTRTEFARSCFRLALGG